MRLAVGTPKFFVNRNFLKRIKQEAEKMTNKELQIIFLQACNMKAGVAIETEMGTIVTFDADEMEELSRGAWSDKYEYNFAGTNRVNVSTETHWGCERMNWFLAHNWEPVKDAVIVE